MGTDTDKDTTDTLVRRHADSPAMRRLRQFRRHKLAMVGVIILGILVLTAILAPWLSRYSYRTLDLANRYAPPNASHWLGTDGTGRDIWARLLYGGRVSLSVALVAVSIAVAVGVSLGGMAGFFGGKTDTIIMRFTDMIMCFPPLIIIIVLVSVLGPSIYNTMAAIGLLSWPGLARLVRGTFLSLREMEYVQAARCLGVQPPRMILKHLLPNAVGPVVVFATLNMAHAIVMEAGLSFLGLGVQPPTPSWGNMLNQAQNLTLVQDMPWLWIPPGLAIVLAVLSINFIGDGLRDAFDPRYMSATS